MRKLFIKFMFWFGRRWHKTSRNKWHITTKWYTKRKEFVPVCHPKAIWKTTDTAKHTPPRNERVCKICEALVKEGMY